MIMVPIACSPTQEHRITGTLAQTDTAAPSSGLSGSREDRINVKALVQDPHDLDRGIFHAIKDDVRLYGNRTNASK
jgi:hypothetical protein